MDQTQSAPDGMDAWTAARLGNAIDVFVDRVAYGPLVLQDPSQAYGMDANGATFKLGQTSSGTVQASARITPTMLVIGALLAYIVLKKV